MCPQTDGPIQEFSPFLRNQISPLSKISWSTLIWLQDIDSIVSYLTSILNLLLSYICILSQNVVFHLWECYVCCVREAKGDKWPPCFITVCFVSPKQGLSLDVEWTVLVRLASSCPQQSSSQSWGYRSIDPSVPAVFKHVFQRSELRSS